MEADTGLGDVIRAWRALGATTDEERRAIARLLGFDLREGAAREAEEPELPPLPARPRPDARGPRSRPIGGDAAPSVEQAGDPIQLVRAPSVADERIPLPAQRLARPTAAPAPVLEPLFAAGWERAIASSLAARTVAAGAVDVARIIAAMARQQPIQHLPRRPRLVSATEIAVVVDTRGTIAWFREDAAQLVEKLDAVTRAPVTVLASVGAPVLGAPGAPLDGDPDDAGGDAAEDGDGRRSPGGTEIHVSAGGRVIGISDLGLGSPWQPGDPAQAAAWAELARALRGRGATLVIVTPVAPARIPSELSRLAACIHWDAATPPGLVHRLVKGMG